MSTADILAIHCLVIFKDLQNSPEYTLREVKYIQELINNKWEESEQPKQIQFNTNLSTGTKMMFGSIYKIQ